MNIEQVMIPVTVYRWETTEDAEEFANALNSRMAPTDGHTFAHAFKNNSVYVGYGEQEAMHPGDEFYHESDWNWWVENR